MSKKKQRHNSAAPQPDAEKEAGNVVSHRRVITLVVLFGLISLAWGGYYVFRTSFVIPTGERVFCLWDDGMISMQYARNLREGAGLVWNPGGERVQGFTNLAVTLVMAGLHFLPFTDNHMSLPFQVLNLLLLGVVLLLVWRIGRTLFPEKLSIAVGSVVATALCTPLALWSLQGSDVGFVTVWLLSAAAVLAQSDRAHGAWPRGLFYLLGLGLLIRPDIGLFYVLFAATSLRYPGRLAPRIALAAVVLFAVVGGQMLFSQLYYGDPLPNTYYLKATGSPKSLVLANGFKQMADWIVRLAIPLLLAGVTLYQQRKDRPVVLFAGCFLTAAAYNIWVGGDWLHEYGSRFLVPVLPLLLILVVAGVHQLVEKLFAPGARETGLQIAITGSVAAGLTLLLNPAATTNEWFNPNTVTMHQRNNQGNHSNAQYVRRFTAESTTIGVHWGGVPPYFSRRTAIDVLGKSDRHIAKLVVPGFIPAHSKWDWDYIVNQRKPDIIFEATRGLIDREDFRRSYYGAGKGNFFFFFVRKDAVDKVLDSELRLQDPVTKEFLPITEVQTQRSG